PQMLQAQQRWSITPAPDAGGYPGARYFRIAIADTDRVLAATAGPGLVVVPRFPGPPEQLWRIDQLRDGPYRIMPKAVPDASVSEPWAVSAAGSSTPTLGRFRDDGDRQGGILEAPGGTGSRLPPPRWA